MSKKFDNVTICNNAKITRILPHKRHKEYSGVEVEVKYEKGTTGILCAFEPYIIAMLEDNINKSVDLTIDNVGGEILDVVV